MCQDVCIEINEVVENISIEVRDFSVSNIISQDVGNSIVLGDDGLLFSPTSGGGGSVESVNGILPDVNGNVVVPIPSKTSDLLNDGSDGTSTYVETDELGVTAFSNDYNDLDNLPTIPTVPNFADQTETNAGTVNNKTIAPNTLSGWWTYVKGLAQTFAQKITFSSGALFSPQVAPTYERGRIYFDDTNDCISFMDSISGTSVQVGYEVLMRARNNTGATILNGSVVYISGAIGQNSTVALAQANTLPTSEIIGIATHDIANNTVGKICVFGLVNDLNTNSFIDGQMLYLSATVAGGLTSSIPASPNFVVALGVVEHAHPTQGKILVRPQRALANNNALGTAQNVPPTQNAVKTALDLKLDKDIATYPIATLPLVGTEVVPIVQGGETKKVPISEIGGGFTQEALATTGTNTLDFDINSFDKITQTGSIDFEGINTSGTKKIEKTFLIQGSENPAHTITFPASWQNLSGVDADSSKVNYIEISLINGTINYSIAKYNIPDVTAPTLLKASFLLESMNTIELLYSEVIDASVVTNTAWYTVAGKTVTAVNILGNKVRVVVNTPFTETDNPLVTFTNQVVGNGIQDASGNKAPNFSQNIGLLVYRFDSFDRANSTTSINSPSDGGSNWVTPFGAVWGIDTNKSYCFGANTVTNQANAVFLETGESNVTVRLKLTYGVTGNASTSILLNYVDNNNYFLIQFGKLTSNNLQYSVLKVSGGTLSTVISATTFGTWVSGTEYTFMVKNNNGVITLYNGITSLVQITDTSLSGTKHGLRIFSGSGSTGNTDRFNDFGVYYG